MQLQGQNTQKQAARTMTAIAAVLLAWTAVMGAASMSGAGRTLLDAITIAVVASLALSGGLLMRTGRAQGEARETTLQAVVCKKGMPGAESETAQGADETCICASGPSKESDAPNPRGRAPHETAYLEISRTFGLSLRERDVLHLLAAGMTGKEIAQELTLSYNTVKSHIRHIYEKTGVHRKQDLIDLIARREHQADR